MEASLSFLGFYSECIEAVAPVPKKRKDASEPTVQRVTESRNTETLDGKVKEMDESREPVFGGRYCLANLQLPNSAIKALQVCVLARHQRGIKIE